MEISSLISLDIIRKGRPFSDGVSIQQLLKKIWQRLNYKIKFIECLPLSDKTIAHWTLQLETIEAEIRKKLINCEKVSLCLDESTDIDVFIFYIFIFIYLISMV